MVLVALVDDLFGIRMGECEPVSFPGPLIIMVSFRNTFQG